MGLIDIHFHNKHFLFHNIHIENSNQRSQDMDWRKSMLLLDQILAKD